MNKQENFTDMEYSCKKKTTKREEFLDVMNDIIPWDEWVDVIKPYYYQGKRGRPPMGTQKMLRMYMLQIWFNLSDPATEDSIYDNCDTMRKFTGIDFTRENVPDEGHFANSGICWKKTDLTSCFFDAINRVMVETGHMMKGATSLIRSSLMPPSSTLQAPQRMQKQGERP